ncbi:MAG: type II toxin-antitoxin system prevent-host-death family antitoxin [Actinobacteria bacterium]|nr:type II toxin-antitoxin system prevent-host-death family antitoxin [Actinomycetota bacterium]MCL6105634.1 type II toxin-antitoxin system prevent-host-death family antitoxin [Actinomycetota bacterium]
MTATELKATLLRVLEEVASGTQVEVTKHGHVIARIVPAHAPHNLKGKLAGLSMTACDDELFTTGQD